MKFSTVLVCSHYCWVIAPRLRALGHLRNRLKDRRCDYFLYNVSPPNQYFMALLAAQAEPRHFYGDHRIQLSIFRAFNSLVGMFSLSIVSVQVLQ